MLRAVVSFAIFIVTLTTFAVAAPQIKPTSVPKPVLTAAPPQPEAMVTLDGEPLFAIRIRVLSFSPEDRARIISARLAKLVRNPLFSLDSIKVAEGESTCDIVSGDTILMSVTEAEAVAEGKTRLALAEELAGKMRSAFAARDKEYSPQALLFDALYSVALTLALIVALLLINRFHPKIMAKIHSWRGTYIRSIRFQSFELLHEERISFLINAILNVSRTALVLGLFFLYIPLVLSFFPWTHGVAAKLLVYALAPLDTIWQTFVASLPKLVFLLVIGVITRYSITFMGFLFSEVEKQTITIPGFYPDWAEPTFKIVRFLMLAFAAVVAFPYLPGSDSPAFKGVSFFWGCSSRSVRLRRFQTLWRVSS